MKKIYSLMLLAGLSTSAFAQVNINNTLTPQQLVQGVLLGNGVTAMNITFNGDPEQIGKFTASAATNLGIDTGMVLSCGDVNLIPGPANVAGGVISGIQSNLFNDPDIGQLLGATQQNDEARLEFDFIPQGDTVKFKYVFASEEYPNFVCSMNDVFGFFLSGPGINGVFTNQADNIALVPGTTNTPVSIFNINGGQGNNPNSPGCPAVNSQYYINNTGNMMIAYNGMTTVLTAIHAVTCGQVYHIKMVISDAGDQVYDSGVFLEANSFSSQSVQLSSTVNIGGNDSVLYEGCGTATIYLQRPGNIANGDTVHFIIGGSPNIGDYNNFPDSVVYLPGQSTASININAYQDNVTEGLDTIVITSISGPCSSIVTELRVYISDVPPVYVDAGADTTVRCAGDPVLLHAVASNGLPAYSYEWIGGVLASGRLQTVNPLVTTDYVVAAYDTCLQAVGYDTIRVIVPVPVPLEVSGSPMIHDIICPGDSNSFSAVAINGTPPYNIFWQNPFVAGPNATFSATEDQWFVVEATDVCNIMHAYDTVYLNLLEVNPLTVFLPEELRICRGESTTAEANVFGGVPPYQYNWTNVSSNTESITVAPLLNSIYEVQVKDFCRDSVTAKVEVWINEPLAEFTHSVDPVDNYKVLFEDQSINPLTFDWDFGDGTVAGTANPWHIFPDSGLYTVNLSMVDTAGCLDTVGHHVLIQPGLRVYLPTAFTPNNDGRNDFWEIEGHGLSEIDFVLFDRWGNKLYDIKNPGKRIWDGKIDGEDAPQGVYAYILSAKGFDGKAYAAKGSLTLLR